MKFGSIFVESYRIDNWLVFTEKITFLNKQTFADRKV